MRREPPPEICQRLVEPDGRRHLAVYARSPADDTRIGAAYSLSALHVDIDRYSRRMDELVSAWRAAVEAEDAALGSVLHVGPHRDPNQLALDLGDEGPSPDELARACEHRVAAFIEMAQHCLITGEPMPAEAADDWTALSGDHSGPELAEVLGPEAAAVLGL